MNTMKDTTRYMKSPMFPDLLGDIGHGSLELPLDARGDPLDVAGADVVAEVHPDRDEDRLRAEVHGEQFEDLLDLVVGQEHRPDPAAQIGRAHV